MAARAGQVEVVRCLLRNGALVDARARVGFFSLKTMVEGITHHLLLLHYSISSVITSCDSARQMYRKVCGHQGGCCAWGGSAALTTHSI